MRTGLSGTEYEIMRIIWEKAPQPTLFAPLQTRLEELGRPCRKNTLITFLSRLVNKGYLEARKTGRRNEYRPLVSEEEFQKDEARGFLDRYYAGSAGGLMTTLVQADMLTEEEYAALRALLEEKTEGR